MRPPSVGMLGGYARALRRHLERRGPQTADDLVQHFVYRAHGWYPESLDGAISELIESGHLASADSRGVYRLTVVPPL